MQRIGRWTIRGVTVACAALLASPVGATTFYVATNGSNAFTCLQAQNPATPKASIAQAIACAGAPPGSAGAGHSVVVGDGVYDEVLTAIPGGTAAAPFTLRAATPRGATLRPTTGSPARVIWLSPTTGYIVIDGLRIDASFGNGAGIEDECLTDVNGRIPGTCGHHIRIVNSEIFGAYWNCIRPFGDSWEFLGLHIYDCGLRSKDDFSNVGGVEGIELSGSFHLVDGCDIHDASWGGVAVYIVPSSLPSPIGSVIRNNIIHDHTVPRANGNRVDHAGVGIFIDGQALVYNNVIYNIGGGAGSGVAVENGSATRVFNNTIANANYGINVGGSGSTGTLVTNNVVRSSTNADLFDFVSDTVYSNNACVTTACASPPCPATSGCALSADPLFVNPAARDFHLQSTSPAIDIGATLVQVASDKDNVPRPQGVGYDLGAYEFTVARPAGSGCSAGPECATGSCVNGVCCDQLCDRACEVCSLAAGASADGVCTARNAGVTCRGAAGPCDQLEQCDGSSPDCPRDRLARSGSVGEPLCPSPLLCAGFSPQCGCQRDDECPGPKLCISGLCVADGRSLDFAPPGFLLCGAGSSGDPAMAALLFMLMARRIRRPRTDAQSR